MIIRSLRAARLLTGAALALGSWSCSAPPPSPERAPAAIAARPTLAVAATPSARPARSAPPAHPAIAAITQTEEVMPNPSELSVGLAGDEVALLTRRGATGLGTGYQPTCLRLLRLRRGDLSLLSKSGCLELEPAGEGIKQDIEGIQLARGRSGWIGLLRVVTIKDRVPTHYVALVRFEEDGSKLTTALRLRAREGYLITRPDGDALVAHANGPEYMTAERLDAEGRSTANVSLGLGEPTVLAGAAMADGYVITRFVDEANVRMGRSEVRIQIHFVPLRGDKAHDPMVMQRGAVETFYLVSTAEGLAAVYGRKDNTEWILPIDGRGKSRGEPVELKVHPTDGSFGPAVGLSSAILLAHSDVRRGRDPAPVRFSLITPSGRALAGGVELASDPNWPHTPSMAVAADGNEGIVAWTDGPKLERFGLARIVVPADPQVAAP